MPRRDREGRHRDVREGGGERDDGPDDREAYGYRLFVVGAAVGILSLVVFALGDTARPGSARQAAGVLAGISLPTVMLGFVYRLPAKGWVDRLALTGAIVCFAALVGFVSFCPERWAVPAGSPAPDRSGLVAGVYAVGVLVITLSALVTGSGRGGRLDAQGSGDEVILSPGRTDENEGGGARYEVYEDGEGGYRWRLRQHGGEVIAKSGGAYRDAEGAEASIGKLRAEARAGGDRNATPTGFEVCNTAGEWRWRLVSDGGVVAESARGYAERDDAAEAVERVRGLSTAPAERV